MTSYEIATTGEPIVTERPPYATPQISGDVLPAAEAAGNSTVDVADANSHCYWGTGVLQGSVKVDTSLTV